MKKLHVLLLILLTLILCTLLCSCVKDYPEPDISALTDAIKASQSWEIDFLSADIDTVNAVFNCDASEYDEVSVLYSSDSASADFIAVFKSSDDNKHTETKKMLEDFLSSRIDDFKGYAPLEVKKLESCRVVSYGKYDILMILPDFSSANEAVGKVFSE